MHIFGDIPMAILLVPVLRCWDRGALPPTSSVHRRPAGEHRSRLEWNHVLLDIVMDDGIDGVCIEMMDYGIHVKAHVKARASVLTSECSKDMDTWDTVLFGYTMALASAVIKTNSIKTLGKEGSRPDSWALGNLNWQHSHWVRDPFSRQDSS
ncbi:hypothetical protein FDECE_13640 [Fusarium decemcellulare]|nr:hypothetical protein FDECE_13640 [Fusarium decemcellulare]